MSKEEEESSRRGVVYSKYTVGAIWIFNTGLNGEGGVENIKRAREKEEESPRRLPNLAYHNTPVLISASLPGSNLILHSSNGTAESLSENGGTFVFKNKQR